MPEVTEVTVPALAESAAELLLERHHPLLRSDLRQRVLNEARGNPLALLELATILQQHAETNPAGLNDQHPMTQRLQAAFGLGLNSVSQVARRLLLLAALDGTGDLRFLATVGGLPNGARYLMEVEQAGLARADDSQRFTFRHPLTKAAVIAGASSAERNRAHQDLANLYPDQPERRAWHLAASTVEPDEGLAAALEVAAHRNLRRGEARTAVRMLVRSAELSPSAQDRSRRMARAAYVGVEVTGDLERSPARLADAAVTDAAAQQSLESATSSAAFLLTRDGDVVVANRLLSLALTEAEADGDISRSAHEEALHTLLRTCSLGRRPDLWENFNRHVERLPDPPVELTIGCRTLRDPARLAGAVLQNLDVATAALATELDPARIVRIAAAGMYIDRIGDCRHSLWRVVNDGRAGGAIGSAVTALSLLAHDAFRAGDWEAADRLAGESETTAEACGGYWTPSTRHLRAFIAAARGDTETVELITDELRRWAPPRGIGASPWAPRCLAAITRGDFDRAYREATVPGPAGVLPECEPYALWMVLDLVEAAVRTDRHAQAQRHVKAVEEARLGDLSSRLALLVGGAAGLTAPAEECVELFASALALPETGRWPFERARVQLLFGERLRRLRRVCEARGQLSAAADTFRRLGAGPWASRAVAELHATGLAPTTQRRSTRGWSLTPQEHKIVDLAASGLTNKQIGERLFLSPRTVGFHLSRAFPKLGVASRSALRDALSNLQPR
ncbi:helix-turn-helix transcriptional regulator [Nocardioides panacihumi]|uniref:helix-turn-helix transcriptional regulator n=1 Tax=Nocardioides panacihumi TaxID=400774 RepID=UPI0031CFD8AC